MKEINISVCDYIKEINEKEKGDYTFPCFSLSKELHKSPVNIANELKEKISSEFIERIESVNGYLNFFINKEYLTKVVFEEFDKNKENYGKIENNGKTVCIDYSAPNIALALSFLPL